MRDDNNAFDQDKVRDEEKTSEMINSKLKDLETTLFTLSKLVNKAEIKRRTTGLSESEMEETADNTIKLYEVQKNYRDTLIADANCQANLMRHKLDKIIWSVPNKISNGESFIAIGMKVGRNYPPKREWSLYQDKKMVDEGEGTLMEIAAVCQKHNIDIPEKIKEYKRNDLESESILDDVFSDEEPIF